MEVVKKNPNACVVIEMIRGHCLMIIRKWRDRSAEMRIRQTQP